MVEVLVEAGRGVGCVLMHAAVLDMRTVPGQNREVHPRGVPTSGTRSIPGAPPKPPLRPDPTGVGALAAVGRCAWPCTLKSK